MIVEISIEQERVEQDSDVWSSGQSSECKNSSVRHH